MNHSEHDLDVLASWASGYEPDRRRAEEFIALCPECAEFHLEQTRIRAMLLEAGTARLRPEEAAALTAAITAAQPVALSTRPAPKPLSPIWGRVLGAAAALAVVTMIGFALQPGGGAATATTGLFSAEAAAGGEADRATTELYAAPATTAAASAVAGDTAIQDGDLARLEEESERLLVAPPEASQGALPCPEVATDAIASAEVDYRDRTVLLLLVEEDGERIVRAFFTDDCSEILLPER